MAHHKIEISQEFNKPVADVYAWLSDHEQLGAIFNAPVSRIKPGTNDLNGVGSVRRIGPAPIGIQETVIDAEENKSIDYIITKFGGPVKNHKGRLDFSETQSGSRVDWVIHFDSFPVIGPILEKVLTQAISRGLSKNA